MEEYKKKYMFDQKEIDNLQELNSMYVVTKLIGISVTKIDESKESPFSFLKGYVLCSKNRKNCIIWKKDGKLVYDRDGSKLAEFILEIKGYDKKDTYTEEQKGLLLLI